MERRLLVRGSQLWNGIEKQILAEDAMLIEDGIIIKTGPFSDLEELDFDKILDFRGCTLMPGLIDSHTHLSMDASLPDYLSHMNDSADVLKERAYSMMLRDLESGVTTCRCLGDREFLDIYCRDAVAEGTLPGPDLLVATRGIRASHGHGFVGYPFDGPEQIKKAIEENNKAGADLIKIYISGTFKEAGGLSSYLSREEIRIAIEEAHRFGLRVASHCVGGEGLDWAVEFGLDTVEHIYHINDEQIEKLDGSYTKVVLTPGPVLNKKIIRNLSQHLIELQLREQELMKERMMAFIKAGIPYAIGTDGLHGVLAEDLEYLVEMGASCYDSLRAATWNGAAVAGVADRKGSLEPGKDADIIAVDGNPMKDIRALQSIKLIIKNGRIIKNSYITGQVE